ncbi:MAG: hypothetical protein ABFS28_07890 [Bacteroidota bacterium]
MDPSDIIRLLNTDHYAPANLEEVNDLCRNFPEFNLAHLLKVRIRESLGQNKEKELKVAAVYSIDRRKLYQLVNGVTQPMPAETESEVPAEEADGIRFADDPYVHADVIIEQHAPYAAPPADEELLELEDEPERGDSFILDTTEDELSSETLIQAMEKGESEMEEPGAGESATPAIDMVEKEESLSAGKTLIREFIKGDPGPIRADNKTSLKGDVSLSSIREHDGFITDTLAKIYVKQGLVAKAIYAYEKLSLKYPEKSAYFAAQIEKVKNINHS